MMCARCIEGNVMNYMCIMLCTLFAASVDSR